MSDMEPLDMVCLYGKIDILVRLCFVCHLFFPRPGGERRPSGRLLPFRGGKCGVSVYLMYHMYLFSRVRGRKKKKETI